MLFLFVTEITKITDTVRGIIIGATLAFAPLYLVSLFGWFSPVHPDGPVGIGFSIGMFGIAALNLMVDFEMVVRGVEARIPKQFEWYAQSVLR